MDKTSEIVPIKQLADELGMDRSHALRLVKRLGIDAIAHRSIDTRNQASVAVSREDADRCAAWRTSHGFQGDGCARIEAPNILYAVAVDPDVRPGRVKVGTSANPESRFASYRATCPEMAILRTWPAPQSCEGYLIALADAFGVRLGQEIFDIEDVDAFIEAASIAFGKLDNQ